SQPPIEGNPHFIDSRFRMFKSFPEITDATPPIRPSQVAASCLGTAQVYHTFITELSQTMNYQHEAVHIASTTLEHNVLAIVDTFETMAAGARSELEKQEMLLAGIESDLEIISRVKIHTEFVSSAVRKAIQAGEKHRTLGDYVSNVKMR